MTVTDATVSPDQRHPETSIATDAAIRSDIVATSSLPLGSGHVIVDAATGIPVQFIDDHAPQRTFLLEPELAWHSVEHAWGTGYVIGDTVAGRWNSPDRIETLGDSIHTHHSLSRRLAIEIERRGGHLLREAYRFRNTSSEPLRITSIGIQTPFADLYPGALDALTRRVHAHVFTGGAWAWVAAQPMSGEGRMLGLRLTEGQLWGYSVETRNINTISNARGHIVMHVTDHARNPEAFGGQPVIELAPGDEYVLAWELGWYADMETFLAATDAPAEFSSFSATVGSPISIRTDRAVQAAEGVHVTATDTGARITAHLPGTYWVLLGDDARTEVLFHETVETTVRKRGDYVLAYQRSSERPGLLANALVPVDTTTRLTQTTNGWSDWTDGSERIGVAIMLQHGLARGWLDTSVDDALEGWAAFAREHLIDDSAAPRRGSQDHHTGIRLYDSPWLAQFFLLRYQQHHRVDDLDLAARLIERAVELGASRLLTIGFSEVTVALADALTHSGQPERAARLRDAIVASARHFIEVGVHLPAHEVAYEQSIVAPLLNLLIDAYGISGDPQLLDEIRLRLPWLLAFGASQPHARLHGVAIRHWDGYWFGQRRQWGDVFPHYWSTLTAVVLTRLPHPLRSAEHDRLAEAILRANMANYFPDGSATCAFVMPTSVDGVAAHVADPLANDQDFHLAMWMQLEADGCTSLA